MITGMKIKELRTSKGWTQEELGNKVGVNRAAVNKWETGRVQNIKRSTIAKLAEIFEVDPITLMGFVEKEDTKFQENETFTEDEIELITLYRLLNDNGKEFVEHIKSLLKSSPEYYSTNEDNEEGE